MVRRGNANLWYKQDRKSVDFHSLRLEHMTHRRWSVTINNRFQTLLLQSPLLARPSIYGWIIREEEKHNKTCMLAEATDQRLKSWDGGTNFDS